MKLADEMIGIACGIALVAALPADPHFTGGGNTVVSTAFVAAVTPTSFGRPATIDITATEESEERFELPRISRACPSPRVMKCGSKTRFRTRTL
ncbi:MAG: hypothetical protein AAGI15_16970 [Pseudomonadota bacterium]